MSEQENKPYPITQFHLTDLECAAMNNPACKVILDKMKAERGFKIIENPTQAEIEIYNYDVMFMYPDEMKVFNVGTIEQQSEAVTRPFTPRMVRDSFTWPNLIAPPMHENPHPDWTDPKLPDIRKIWELAREVGYAVGVHGSLRRDIDLIAAPWTGNAVSGSELIEHLCKGLNAKVVDGPENKPMGRVAVSLQIDGWFKVIDLSICPRHPEI